MKIIHCCLANFYIDNFGYQENELPIQNSIDGHSVTIIASTETYNAAMELSYVDPCRYTSAKGIEVIRIPYIKMIPQFLSRKLRIHTGLMGLLNKLTPDIILFHGACGWELNTIRQYRESHPDVRFYVDSHEDFNNSAKHFISKWILHYLYYRPILIYNLRWIDKILCVNLDSMTFLSEFYRVPSNRLEFYPLGGHTWEDDDYYSTRSAKRKELNLIESNIVFIQAGKFDKTKGLLDALESFVTTKDRGFRFLIVGYIYEDVRSSVEELMIRDERIQFLGWKSAEDLSQLLCAADVYLQPKSQSATMQTSICCRCAIVLDDIQSHRPYLKGNGWLVGKDYTLSDVFTSILLDRAQVSFKMENSRVLGQSLLSYKTLASRLYY